MDEGKSNAAVTLVTLRVAYTGGWATAAEKALWADDGMVERRIKSHPQEASAEARRAEQRRLYRRNQVFGLLIVAAVIVAWWLVHTNSKWIFPPGWWRP